MNSCFPSTYDNCSGRVEPQENPLGVKIIICYYRFSNKDRKSCSIKCMYQNKKATLHRFQYQTNHKTNSIKLTNIYCMSRTHPIHQQSRKRQKSSLLNSN